MLYKPRRDSGGKRHRLLAVTGYNNRTTSKNFALMWALMKIFSAVCLDGCSHSSHRRPEVLGCTPHSQVSQHSQGSWQTVAHIVGADWGGGGESAHRDVEPHWHLVEVWKLTAGGFLKLFGCQIGQPLPDLDETSMHSYSRNVKGDQETHVWGHISENT